MHKIVSLKAGLNHMIELKFQVSSLKRNLEIYYGCQFKIVLWLDKSLKAIAVNRFISHGGNYNYSGNRQFYVSYVNCYKPIIKVIKSRES